jgi:RNA 2',3'-cyclic 3'-phosphodiesterase
VDAERARLFVALELPVAVRAALSDWSREQLTDLARLRPVRTESLHVTLCFLGSQPASAVGRIAAACRVAASLPAVALSLGEALWLPRRRPRVLAIKLGEEGNGRLGGVQAALAGALEAGGFYEPEPRPFFAHVTVARVASGKRLGPVELPPPAPLCFQAANVTLFRSMLGSGPARYEALDTVALAG